MSRFILLVDGDWSRRYASRSAAVRAGKREAKRSYRVIEELSDGGSRCVDAWDREARA